MERKNVRRFKLPGGSPRALAPPPGCPARAFNHHHHNHNGDSCHLSEHDTISPVCFVPMLLLLLLVRSARTGARTRGCSTPACRRSGRTSTARRTFG